jgi:NADPH-dependent glutamate synthase beta subunit-like oxidoreductase/Pyruvate/2-oxoacid:ferredoxin oxidoreductase delta subunit
MGLLNKNKKKKALRTTGRGAAGAMGSSARPKQVTKLPPCVGTCPSSNAIRGWLTAIAQREKTGLSEDQAYEKAWRIICETNPFPAVMGRVCPHPCETGCSRELKDGAVSINACERFIGDWGLEHGLTLSHLDEEAKPESIGVIGAGPAGLAFAYQMRRRGYEVTIYEKTEHAGGMLYWGIPFYRLPADVLQGEVDRIVAMGVDLKLNTAVGEDITVDELRAKHKILFLGIGAHKGKLMRIENEEGPGVWTGTDYLHQVNAGTPPELGKSVVVIGGGDTAIDAAREARRTGAEVTILYRRTRVEMPAIDSEVEDLAKEGIGLDLLVAPVGFKRDGEKLTHVVAQKMELGEPDDSGRRRPVPIEGSEYDIAIDSCIAAVSQQPDWIEALKPETRWLEPDATGKIEDDVWAGGDVIDLGLATTAVAHGMRAGEAADHFLRGTEPKPKNWPEFDKSRLKLDFYEAKEKAVPAHRPVEEWLSKPTEEIVQLITGEQFESEVNRCFSCGFCFGCERCWMYCTPGCFKKVPEPGPGNYYTADLTSCDGCNKCRDECPCAYIDMS